MKPHVSSLRLTLASLLLALPVAAQPPAVPAPPPAAPAPGAPPAPPAGVPLLPPPSAPAVPAEPPLGPFKDRKERHSYGLGTFLGNREKQNAATNPEKPTVNAEDLLAGLRDGLKGAKSLDYTGGLAMAAQIKRSGVEIDTAVLEEALTTALEAKPGKVAAEEIQVIMQEIQTGIQQRQQAKAKAEAEKNLAESNAWLEENAKKEGVKVTASGLQYVIEAPGEGRAPGPKDIVSLNLTGTTRSAAEFEKSPEGTPARKSLAGLPPGLQEGLQLLKVGGKAKFWLPPALGFGEKPRHQAVKSNDVLAYSVELTAVDDPPAAPAAPQILGADGKPVPGARREPVTAVTPPVSVEIPPGGGPPKIRVEPAPAPPAGAPPQAPPPAPGK